jgi:sugar lactone lactonase YvrE
MGRHLRFASHDWRARLAVAPALLGALALGCGGGEDADTCATGGGDGMLMVDITGHDPGAVMVAGATDVVETDTVLTLPAGVHAVTAMRVAAPQTGITSQVFEGTVDRPMVCVTAGATTIVTVSYALIPTSGKLWLGISNAPDDSTLLGFAPASVATSRTSTADVAVNTGGSDGFTFDRDGNIWVLGGTTADPPLARYRASTFAADGLKVPDVVIDSPSFSGALPGPKVVAFDPAGNLWVSVVAAGKVVKFTAAQIAANGAPVASVERSGLTAPQGLAFDAAGNLWVAVHDENAVVRIDAAHLGASGSGSDLAITAERAGGGTLATPVSLAFDEAGSLWVNYDGILASIPAAAQTGTGEKTITAAVEVETDVLTLPAGIAFDQGGGLWLAHAAGKFARYDPVQLAASGTIAPAIVITSPDVGSAAWFAMYPAPAFTPLYHKVP